MNKFLVGSSTAAHQVEGNNIHSDYYAMENMKYSEFTDKSGLAVDHYNRYKEDILLMKEAGLNAYRFSIEWARIEPSKGTIDQKELDHYLDVIKTCKENGIEPIVTLLHFTSPRWLIEEGGWENRSTIYYFKNYVRVVMSYLGKYLNYVCTINEANMGVQINKIAERYKRMYLEQMKKSQEGIAQVGMNFDKMMENMQNKAQENIELFGSSTPQTFVSAKSVAGDLLIMEAHMEARKVIKEMYPSIKVGITLSLHDIQPLDGGEEVAIKEWNDEFSHYIPFIENDDFIGVQNYTRTLVNKEGNMNPPKDSILTQMGYEYYPKALYNVVKKVYEEIKRPIFITENGIATDDDNLRISFIKEATGYVKELKDEGIPLLGYMHWSFIDNFEWQKGFSMKFGLVSVDRENGFTRKPKDSLYVLGDFAKEIN